MTFHEDPDTQEWETQEEKFNDPMDEQRKHSLALPLHTPSQQFVNEVEELCTSPGPPMCSGAQVTMHSVLC